MAKKKRGTKPPRFLAFLTDQRAVVFLSIICFFLYANTLRHGYVLDDAILITENALTKRGISGIADIFTHDTFYGFFQDEGKANLVSGGRYRPLSQVLFAITYDLFGDNPFWGHLINIVLYLLCVMVVFYFLASLKISGFRTDQKRFFAFAGAVLFAAHPIHTEVVSNIKGADEILALILALLSSMVATRVIRVHPRVRFIASTVLFLLAMLAKEVALGLLVAIPIGIYLMDGKGFRHVWKTTAPLFLGFALYLGMRIAVLGWNMGSDPPMELLNNPFLKFEGNRYIPMTLAEKVPLIIYGLGKYLQLTIWPHPLTHDYYPRYISLLQWADIRVLLSILSLLVLGLLVIRHWTRRHILSFGILFFFSTLIITANILFPVGTHLSERFLFTPSLGFCIVVSFLVVKYTPRFGAWPALGFALVVTIYAALTVQRNPVWYSNYTLFTTDVMVSSNSAKAQNAAAGSKISRARELEDTVQANVLYQQALKHLSKAIEIHPLYKNAYLLRGNAHYYLKNYESAVQAYDKALLLDPNYQEALQNRAITYRDWGRYAGEVLGDLDLALEYLQKAAAELKEDYETNRLLGVAYGNKGLASQAIPYFHKALERKPQDGWTHFNLGMAYLSIADTVKANHYLSKAKEINPKIGLR